MNPGNPTHQLSKVSFKEQEAYNLNLGEKAFREDFAAKMKKLREQFPLYDVMTENAIDEVEVTYPDEDLQSIESY